MRPHMHWNRLVASAMLATAVAAPAGASTVCGGSTFSTCASVAVTKVLLSNGNVRVRMEVLNEAGLGHTYRGASFTRIGLWGIPETAQYVDASLFVGGEANPNDWRLAKASDEDEESDDAKRADKKAKEDPVHARMKGVRLKRGVIDGLQPGKPAVFEFDLTGVSIDDVNTRDWVVRAEVERGACATDMVGRNGTVSEARDERALCAALLTPEPPSIVLLATALAGLTALAWRRFPRV